MINRIRDIRRQKGMTLADVAERCTPPTTAQTIGRLETGMRNLSLVWMNRIAAALGVEPELLVKDEGGDHPAIIARLGESGAEALAAPVDAILPSELGASFAEGSVRVVMAVDASAGDYRAGDQIWMEQVSGPGFARFLNRDVLAPRPGGRFAFGRLIDHDGTRVALLPPGPGQRQIVIENPAWLAVGRMLVRPL